MISREEVEKYAKMPHTIMLIPYGDGSYFAEIAEFSGCMTEGETLEETLEMIKEAKELWIESELEESREIPLPAHKREYSGKFNVRVPASLHKKLARYAENEGVSLNQMVISLLNLGLEGKQAQQQIALLNAINEKLDRLTGGISADGPTEKRQVG